MRLKFEPRPKRVFRLLFASYVKTGRIVAEDNAGVPEIGIDCRSFAQVETRVAQLREDLDSILKSAQAYFSPVSARGGTDQERSA